MAYALKLAKGQSATELCPYMPDDLKQIIEQSLKQPQKEVLLGHDNKVLIGGENVLYRHDKTFINKTVIAVLLDLSKADFEEKLERILDFEITRVNEIFKVDLVCLKGENTEVFSLTKQKLDESGIPWILHSELESIDIDEVVEKTLCETVEELTRIRKHAVLDKDEEFSNPVYVAFEHAENLFELCARASFYLCKYANMLIFEDFDEALFSTLMTLRQNIYTDPQKPLQVESKVYEFNNPDENALVFLTTNFALTYFAVANELEALNRSSYLVVTPSEGMSVLTAWSAEKFTAQIVAKTVKEAGLDKKIKHKQIIIPGLLSHMKGELEEALPDFNIVVGSNEAYLIGDLVKSLES